MRARIRAQLRRLSAQPVVWVSAAGLLTLAALGSRWSPKLVQTAPPGQLEIGIAGAVELATTQLATGLGVALAALLTAAGPGRDFADGKAEQDRVNGNALPRFLSRTLALLTVMTGLALALTALLLLAPALAGARGDLTLQLRTGAWRPDIIATGAALATFHIIWILALGQHLRTQTAQLALPIAITFVLLLLSRLTPWPLTPDGWLGPLLDLRADRANRDFWWSIGGSIHNPAINATLLLGIAAGALIAGVTSDELPRARARTPQQP